MAGLIFGAIILASTANCISISVSSDGGGFTEVIDAGYDDRVFGRTVIGSNRLSNIIEGGGSLKETHSVSNRAGATAEVGVNISQAEWFSYSYNLWPGEGSSWKASQYPHVAASEALEVSNANYIRAYADAFNSNGYSASVSIELSDPAKKASLAEYRNLAMASKDEVFASQTADSVFSLDGEIQFDAQAGLLQMKPLPASFREDLSTASMKIDRGAAEGYSDLASASSQGMTASQQVDRAMGELIQTRSEASSLAASLSQSLKAADSRINTRIEGNLTGYAASAESLDGVVQTDKKGHIIGSFISTAVAGKERKSRTSNYGTEYDFVMHARRNASTSYANGFLGYYVGNGRPIDNVSPTGNRIQGAVDASESGDTINIAPGTYFENVKVDKSLDIKGAGADKTIVDGRTDTSGSYQDMLRSPKSVFIVGREDPQVDVSIFGVTIQGGSGTFTDIGWDAVRSGGGILNFATLELDEVAVSDNNALYGGGIANIDGTLSLKNNSNINNNLALQEGGGIFNSGSGAVSLFDNSHISDNIAIHRGGGILNSWQGYGNCAVNLYDNSYISGNEALYEGGGIYNYDYGTVSLNNNSHISGNDAVHRGGGVASSWHGLLSLNDDSYISGNAAYEGGGVFSGSYSQV
ncbi:MAG: hypothetical protein WBI23_06150, partial [Methanothrix sp.]